MEDRVKGFTNALDAIAGQASTNIPANAPWKPDWTTTSHIVNTNVIPNLRLLLAEILGATDAAIPNKEQNKALKHIIRSSFDRTYFDIHQRAYPDCNYSSGPGYALSPETDRYKAFSDVLIK